MGGSVRWYAWAAVVFFSLVAAIGCVIATLARIFVDAIQDGTWILNDFLMEGVAGVQKAGDDPLEVAQFYFVFGIVILFLGLAGAAGSGVIGHALSNKRSPAAVDTRAAKASAPPGWYPLLDGTGRVAWWDGSGWTLDQGSGG